MEITLSSLSRARQHIDAVGLNARVADFQKRSMKSHSKVDLLQLAVRMVDLTTLEGFDTKGKVQQLCEKAKNPIAFALRNEFFGRIRNFPEISPVAAVCVYPNHVKTARETLAGSSVKVASVAGYFPAGAGTLELRLQDIRDAVQDGADEIDIVINRGAFLEGNLQKVYDEVKAAKEACTPAVHLKVILETGELGTYENIRMASFIAMEAGADFIKTSTGKYPIAATMESTLVMLRAISDFYKLSGRQVGMKPAGGIRTAKQAIQYLVMVKEVLGEAWMTPDYFRFGASTLLNDLLRQICKEALGYYFYDNVFAAD